MIKLFESKKYAAIRKSYLILLKKEGYNLIDMTREDEDSGVYFIGKEENPDNPKEPYYYFYNIFPGAPLSCKGYKETVVDKKDSKKFIEAAIKRLKASRVTKSNVVFALLQSRKYNIDDIYPDGKLKITNDVLTEISYWLFKGADNIIHL